MFRPDDGLDVRNPTSNEKENGSIVNPPRFAEFGGLSSGNARGINKNNKTIQLPGSTIRREPQSNRKT
jgi:hypothetical protein